MQRVKPDLLLDLGQIASESVFGKRLWHSGFHRSLYFCLTDPIIVYNIYSTE